MTSSVVKATTITVTVAQLTSTTEIVKSIQAASTVEKVKQPASSVQKANKPATSVPFHPSKSLTSVHPINSHSRLVSLLNLLAPARSNKPTRPSTVPSTESLLPSDNQSIFLPRNISQLNEIIVVF
jgi:hypothetical protein